jgi:hypothetical protein
MALTSSRPISRGLRRPAAAGSAACLVYLAQDQEAKQGNRSGSTPSYPCIDQQDSGGPGGSSRVPRGWSGERSDPPGQHVTAAAVLVGPGWDGIK